MEDNSLEEQQKRERVQEVLSRLEEGYAERFGEHLELSQLENAIRDDITRLQYAMVTEALKHLQVRHSFDPSDLFRALKIVQDRREPRVLTLPSDPPQPEAPKPISVALKAALEKEGGGAGTPATTKRSGVGRPKRIK
jgi:hypothetical protein